MGFYFRRREIVVAASAIALSVISVAPVVAQSSQPASDKSGSDALETVVVTAQRRPENLQKTPIAATVLSGADLVKKSVVRVEDLQQASPSLSVTSEGLTQNINIRGIGLSVQDPAVVSGVALYRDGLFQPPIITDDPFFDTANVEVLRGPQGTFIGSNSTGGAVFITSRSPTLDDIKGYGQIFGGSYADFGAQGAVNLPLNDELAARLAGNFERRDSFNRSIGPFPPPGSLDQRNARLGILYQPVEALQILIKSEFGENNTDGLPERPIPGTPYAPYAPSDPFVFNYDTPVRNYERVWRNSAEIKYTLPDGVVIRSLTGYQKAISRITHDGDGAGAAPLPSLVTPQNTDENIFSQEINLLSPTSGPFQWILGGFYLDDHIDLALQEIVFNAPVVNAMTQSDKKVEAGFGQLGYTIIPDVQLQLGLRYSHDDQRNSGTLDLLGTPQNQDTKFSDNALTGKAAVNWQLDDNHYLYAFAARGYKSGGANTGTTSFSPEHVWDYEAGWKGSFADDHLRTQLGGFYMNYSNIQIQTTDPTTGLLGVFNVAKATIDGVEAQMQAQLGPLGFDFGGAYVHSDMSGAPIIDSRQLPDQGALPLGPQCSGAVHPGCFDYRPYYPFLFTPNSMISGVGRDFARRARLRRRVG